MSDERMTPDPDEQDAVLFPDQALLEVGGACAKVDAGAFNDVMPSQGEAKSAPTLAEQDVVPDEQMLSSAVASSTGIGVREMPSSMCVVACTGEEEQTLHTNEHVNNEHASPIPHGSLPRPPETLGSVCSGGQTIGGDTQAVQSDFLANLLGSCCTSCMNEATGKSAREARKMHKHMSVQAWCFVAEAKVTVARVSHRKGTKVYAVDTVANLGPETYEPTLAAEWDWHGALFGSRGEPAKSHGQNTQTRTLT